MAKYAARIVRAFVDALNRGDLEDLRNLLAPDLSYTLMGYELPDLDGLDRNGVLQSLPVMMAMFEDGSPHLNITNVISQGSWVVVESEGTGFFRNGAPYKNRYGVFFEVVDGKIKTIREYLDTQHRATLMNLSTSQPADQARDHTTQRPDAPGDR
ncbi:nuclear transport factor 2 family protein [Streptomyces roseifaciens]